MKHDSAKNQNSGQLGPLLIERELDFKDLTLFFIGLKLG
jgi:hypothetical protein